MGLTDWPVLGWVIVSGAGVSVRVEAAPYTWGLTGWHRTSVCLRVKDPVRRECSKTQRRAKCAARPEQIMGCCCCSVAQPCLALCDPMGCSTSGSLVLHYLPEFAQTHVHPVGDVIQPSHSPSIFPSIRVFFNESALCLKWPKYWSFSFIISPSSEY